MVGRHLAKHAITDKSLANRDLTVSTVGYHLNDASERTELAPRHIERFLLDAALAGILDQTGDMFDAPYGRAIHNSVGDSNRSLPERGRTAERIDPLNSIPVDSGSKS